MNKSLNYFLPKESIAQSPVSPRDHCKLFVIDGNSFYHKKFYDIIDFLKKDDILIFNNTKVRKVRVFSKKKSGGKLELLIIGGEKNIFKCLIKGKARIGTAFLINDVEGIILEKNNEIYTVKIPLTIEEIESIGVFPTPPYIKKIVTQEDWYQTVFAKEKGSVAAPTAGLHFTESLLNRLKKKGIIMISILLHVGLGTFLHTTNKDYMKEYYRLATKQAEIINKAKGKIYAVGTTTIKALETCSKNNVVYPSEGWSDLFITSAHKFQSPIDGLITNFHMPNSPPIQLTAAYAGSDLLLKAYEEAVANNYRFLSLGDSMLIIPCSK